MNTWRIVGSHERAVSPSEVLSTGTVLQPRTVWPSDWTIFSKRSSRRLRLIRSRGRKTSPHPYSPGAGKDDLGLLARLLQERVRHLHQHAGAVAGVRLGAGGAAVVEVLQQLDAPA